MEAMPLAAQGEDNFAPNDLALLEISAVDHRIEVLDKKGRSKKKLLEGGIIIISAQNSGKNIHKKINHTYRGFSGDCEGNDSPGRRTRRGVRMR
jgi:hypothetical protein